jgi:hypothetical protein
MKRAVLPVFIVPLLLIGAGAALAIVYQGEPRFVSYSWYSQVPWGDSEAYFEHRDANENPLAIRADIGRGFASFGTALLLWLIVFGPRTVAGIEKLHTPSRRLTIYLMTNVALIGFIAAQSAWMQVLIYERELYPSWGDNGVMQASAAMWLLLIPLLLLSNLLLQGTMRESRLPAPLWERPRRSTQWVLTILAAILLALLLWTLVDSIYDGAVYTIPFILLAMFAVLCARAAAASGPRT